MEIEIYKVFLWIGFLPRSNWVTFALHSVCGLLGPRQVGKTTLKNVFRKKNLEESYLWRSSFIMTFLERDIPQWGFQIPSQQMRRFWLMLAHYHGQILNASELASSMSITTHAIRKYLDILAGN
ncbi:MAG: hypothetical protein H0T62_05765 [Parachlamydiaceae bacterium]|nr:hypothetical protein [Parachlamydiaceae bacterium]